MTVTDTFADFALSPLDRAAETALIYANLSLFDWAACGRAGWQSGGFQDWAIGIKGTGDAPTFMGTRLDAPTAALVNGTLSHALDYDDTHFAHIGHPSVAIYSAVMAVATDETSFANLSEAALIGLEGSVRVGQWLGRAHYQVGYHQTATSGAFGATLAVGRLIGLNHAQMRNALGLCATMASGLKGQFGTMGKPLNAGLAARTGVEAAVWAQLGMTSDPDGLGGSQGFGATHHGTADPSALDDIGDTWRFETINYKFHACCHGLHAMLEGLKTLQPTPDFGQMTIATHPRWMAVCNVDDPTTGLAAKFSYRHTAAMTAVGMNTGDIAAFSDGCATDERLVALRQNVQVMPDASLSEMQARVTLDGVEAFHDLAAPLGPDVSAQKLRDKAQALIGKATSGALWVAMRQRDLGAFRAACFQ